MLPRMFFILCLCVLSAPPVARATDSPRVAVSIKPLHSLVSALMAGVGEPVLIVKGSRSPHSYSMKPSDARTLSEADIVIWVGPGLEQFLEKPLLALSKKADILTLEPNPKADPHLWLSPALAGTIVDRSLEKLLQTDPGHGDIYKRNAVALKNRLHALQEGGRSLLSPLKHRPFLVFHDAWGHFASAFGISIAGTVALNPDRPPTAKRISAIRRTLKERKITCLFKEPQFSSPFLSNLLEGFTDIRVMELDPIGTEYAAGADAYFSMMDKNLKAVAACLKPQT